jgi:hypothetical protein
MRWPASTARRRNSYVEIAQRVAELAAAGAHFTNILVSFV